MFLATNGPQTYDFYFGEEIARLSDEDRNRLDTLIEQLGNVPEVRDNSRKFFNAVERDAAISGVGVAEGRSSPPVVLIPDTEFAQRGGLWTIEEEAPYERVRYALLDVVLVRPALSAQPRSWTFELPGLPEFDAKMKDQRFLNALRDAHVRESLRVGIQMRIRLEIKERNVGGEWTTKRGGRSVVEVLSPKVD